MKIYALLVLPLLVACTKEIEVARWHAERELQSWERQDFLLLQPVINQSDELVQQTVQEACVYDAENRVLIYGEAAAIGYRQCAYTPNPLTKPAPARFTGVN